MTLTPSFNVLALDGGGYRGLGQAQTLAELEARTGRRTVDCFDLITGTSTGGILALALSLGVPASRIVDFYVTDGRQIFPTNAFGRWLRGKKRWAWPAHGAGPLQRALRGCLSHGEGAKSEPRLGDALTRLVIPSFQLAQRKPYLFKTDHRDDYQMDWRRPMWEVAMATSAAPTYFPYFTSSRREHFSDGGLWANNPSLVGIVEAETILGIPRDCIRVLNLGNGLPNFGSKSPSWFKRMGLIGWASDAAELLMDSNAYTIPRVSSLFLGDRYVRLSPNISHSDFPLDLYDPDALIGHGLEVARQNITTLESFYRHSAPPYSKARRETTI